MFTNAKMFTDNQLALHDVIGQLRELCGDDLAYQIQSKAQLECKNESALIESLQSTLSLMKG